jgi:Protein of unknown function (DUF998)
VRLSRVVVAGAVVETGCWLTATLLAGPDAWRHDISSLSAVGGAEPWWVIPGELAFAVAVAAAAVLLGRSTYAGDHVLVARVLLTAGAVGLAVQALAREGSQIGGLHGPSAVVAMLTICGAALVLSAPLRSRASAVCGVAALAMFAVPDGLAQRLGVLVVSAWLAVTALALERAASPRRPADPRAGRVRHPRSRPPAARLGR